MKLRFSDIFYEFYENTPNATRLCPKIHKIIIKCCCYDMSIYQKKLIFSKNDGTNKTKEAFT